MDYFNIGAGKNEQAWHGKLKIFTDEPTITEAMQRCDMLYRYELLPTGINVPVIGADGVEITHFLPMDTQALVRMPVEGIDDMPLYIGTRGSRYQLIQNEDFGTWLDPLTPNWPVDTVGVLHDWKVTFATLKMEPFAVGGHEQEEHDTWLVMVDDKRGPGAAYWGTVVKRIVCSNTLNAAMRTAKEMSRIPHVGLMRQALSFRSDMAAYVIAQRAELNLVFNRMIQIQANKLQVAQIFEAAFPFKSEPSEMELVRAIPEGLDTEAVQGMRATAAEKELWMTTRNEFATNLRLEAGSRLTQFDDEFSYAAGTLYGAFQAITGVANHSPLYRGDANKQFAAVLFGDRKDAMNRAYAEIETMLS